MIPSWFLFVFSAYILHSISTTFDKHLLKSFHSSAFGFFKMAMNFVILIVIVVIFFFQYLPATINWLYLLIILGFLFALGTIFYMFAMQKGAMSELVPYDYSLTIVASFFLASLFFSEKIYYYNIIGVALIFFGIWLILTKKGLWIPKFNLPVLLMTFHFIVIVIYQLLSKHIAGKLNPFVISLNMYFFCSIFVLMFMLVKQKSELSKTYKLFSKKQWFWLFLASGTAVLGTAFIYIALSKGAATKVLPVSGVLPFFIVLFGGTLFKEGNLLRKIIGTLFIFGGIFLIAI